MKEKNFRRISNIFIIVTIIYMLFYVPEVVSSFDVSLSTLLEIFTCLYSIGFIIFVKTQLTNKYENTGLKIFFIIAILKSIILLVDITDYFLNIRYIVPIIYYLIVDILLFLNVIKRKNKILPYVLIIFCVIMEACIISSRYTNFKIEYYSRIIDGIMSDISSFTYLFVVLYQTLYIFYYNRDSKEKIKKSTIISTIILALALIFYIFISLNVPKLVLSSMVNQITKIGSTNFEGNTVKGQLILGSNSKYNKKKANYNVSTLFYKEDASSIDNVHFYSLRRDFEVRLDLMNSGFSDMSKCKSFVVNDRTFYIEEAEIFGTIFGKIKRKRMRISVVTDLGNGLEYNIIIVFEGALSEKDIMYLRPFFEVTV